MRASRYCWFCAKNVQQVDYKQSATLAHYLSSYGKIVPRKRSGVCATCQRRMTLAVKRARMMALLPFVNR